MNFDLDDDQLALRDGIRALLEGKLGMSRVRDGFDRAVHDELAGAGVFTLLADGFTWADAAIVFEELGRACVPGPLAWSALGLAPGVVGGVEAPMASGAPILVEHLDQLEALVVLGPDAIRLVDPATVDGEPVAWPLDPLTPVWKVTSPLGGDPVGDARDARAAHDGLTLLTAAQSVGLADACLALAVAYAKEREQFGRVIGSFQAVKHLCADMAVRVEVARAAVHAAACLLDDPESGDQVRALAGAKLLASEAGIANGRSATQVFGGMGFTWEVDVHLYLKRAWVLDTVGGSSDAHADAVAARL